MNDLQSIIQAFSVIMEETQKLQNDLIVASESKDIYATAQTLIKAYGLFRQAGMTSEITAKFTILVMNDEERDKLDEWLHETPQEQDQPDDN